MQNPEALKLKEKIVEAIRQENAKWKGTVVGGTSNEDTFSATNSKPRWNRGGAGTSTNSSEIITSEVSDAAIAEDRPKKWSRSLIEKWLNRQNGINKK